MEKVIGIKDKVRGYIKENTFVDNQKIQDESMLFKDGFFDSMGFVLLLTYIEDEFKIQPQDSDLVEENFESINAISSFVLKRSAEVVS